MMLNVLQFGVYAVSESLLRWSVLKIAEKRLSFLHFTSCWVREEHEFTGGAGGRFLCLGLSSMYF